MQCNLVNFHQLVRYFDEQRLRSRGFLLASRSANDAFKSWTDPFGNAADYYAPNGLSFFDDGFDRVQFGAPPPWQHLRFMSQAERRDAITAMPVDRVNVGTVLFHGGSLENWKKKECCFYLSYDENNASNYVGQDGDDSGDGLSAFVVTKPLVVYGWSWFEKSRFWGYDKSDLPDTKFDSWDEFYDSDGRGEFVANVTFIRGHEFSFNKAIDDLGLDGTTDVTSSWLYGPEDQFEEEVMVTSAGMEKLRQITLAEAKERLESAGTETDSDVADTSLKRTQLAKPWNFHATTAAEGGGVEDD